MRYKLAKKEAKKAVRMQELRCTKKCMRSWTPKRLKYRIARIRERKTRDLCIVRCVKDENQKVLV